MLLPYFRIWCHILFNNRNLVTTIQQTVPYFEGMEITTHIAYGKEAVPVALELQQNGVDVIVTGQHNFGLLKKMLDIPVINSWITYKDLVNAVKNGLPFGRKMVLVTPALPEDVELSDLEVLEELAKVTLKYVNYASTNELEQKFTQLKKEEVTVVIGTLPVCLFAQKYGMKGINIYSLEESFQNTICRAIEAVRSKYQQEEEAKRFKAILDSAHEGIITADYRGIITFCNSSVEKILNLGRENILNTHLSQIIKCTQGTQIYQPGYGMIEHVGNATVVANHVPVRLKNQLIGTVTTFQDITRIQELENIIRLKTYSKGMEARFTFDQIVGKSKAIGKTIATARKYAESDFTVLIEGETGSGKEIFTQSIHNHSKRRLSPFVVINCSALPENLLESELFGYDKGAFTGALRQGKKGLFEVAHNGSIFLDEISSISPNFQSKLLRVIQEQEIMRVGSDKVIPVNVRIIAATNESLGAAVFQGKFRSDLYFRLNVLILKIPPLRQRQEDIAELFHHFVKRFEPGLLKNLEPFLSTITKPLLLYEFPGNVRELMSIVQRFLILLDRSMLDNPHYLTELIHDCIEETLILPSSFPTVAIEIKESLRETLEEAEKKIITRTLTEENNDKAKAARKLGLSRTTLYRKISMLGI